MKPNQWGGFTLAGMEKEAARLAAKHVSPKAEAALDPLREAWDHDEDRLVLPLDVDATTEVMSVVREAWAHGVGSWTHRIVMHDMLVDANELDPTVGYHVRRAGAGLLRLIEHLDDA